MNDRKVLGNNLNQWFNEKKKIKGQNKANIIFFIRYNRAGTICFCFLLAFLEDLKIELTICFGCYIYLQCCNIIYSLMISYNFWLLHAPQVCFLLPANDALWKELTQTLREKSLL